VLVEAWKNGSKGIFSCHEKGLACQYPGDGRLGTHASMVEIRSFGVSPSRAEEGKKQGSTAEEMDWSLVKILGGITQKGNPPFDKQTPWPDLSRESRILVF
jgi:hypothetical protein